MAETLKCDMIRLMAPVLPLLVAACASHGPAEAPPPPAPSASNTAPAPVPAAPVVGKDDGTAVCHPLVSGCGCAYQCATGMKLVDEATATWEVTHDWQDSRTDRARVERWCFDARGVGSVEAHRQPGADRCLEVFAEQPMICGGECIPMTKFLGCHAVERRCVP